MSTNGTWRGTFLPASASLATTLPLRSLDYASSMSPVSHVVSILHVSAGSCDTQTLSSIISAWQILFFPTNLTPFSSKVPFLTIQHSFHTYSLFLNSQHLDVCPSGRQYKSCGPLYPITCANYHNPASCSQHCLQGCFCPNGMVELEGDCVLPSQCPNEGTNTVILPHSSHHQNLIANSYNKTVAFIFVWLNNCNGTC